MEVKVGRVGDLTPSTLGRSADVEVSNGAVGGKFENGMFLIYIRICLLCICK